MSQTSKKHQWRAIDACRTIDDLLEEVAAKANSSQLKRLFARTDEHGWILGIAGRRPCIS
jgi:hypothetical protein